MKTIKEGYEFAELADDISELEEVLEALTGQDNQDYCDGIRSFLKEKYEYAREI